MNHKRTISDVDQECESTVQKKRLKLIDTNDSSLRRKVDKVVRREFYTEICKKEEEILLINERLNLAKRLLDRLRACIIASYYGRVMCGNGQQQHTRPDPTLPTPIHPTVKRLLGKSVRHSAIDTFDIKPLAVNSSDTSISKKSASSGYTSGSTSRPSSASSSFSSVVNECPTTAKRWNPSKITKRVVIGNVSKYLAAGKKDANDMMRYKWMVYVQGSTKEERDISHFVEKVVFMLDESYRPHDVITVSQPPFTLKRHGWGEFPVRVQLHFKGSATKCVDIIHELKLDKTHTGWTTLGAETTYDLNVDSNLFSNMRSANFTPPQVSPRRRHHRQSSPSLSASIASASELELVAVVKAEPLDETNSESSANITKQLTLANQEVALDMNSIDAICEVSIKSEPCSPSRYSTSGVSQRVQSDVIAGRNSSKLKISPCAISVSTLPSPTVSSTSNGTVLATRSCRLSNFPQSNAKEDHTGNTVHIKLEPASPGHEPCSNEVNSVQCSYQSSPLDVCSSVTVEQENSNCDVLGDKSAVRPRVDKNACLASDNVIDAVDVEVCADKTIPTTSAPVQLCSIGKVLTGSDSTCNVSSGTLALKYSTPSQDHTGISTQVLSTSSQTCTSVSIPTSSVLRSVSCATTTTPVSKQEHFISCRDTSGRMLLIPKSLLASMQVASSGQALSTSMVSRTIRTVAKAVSVSSSSSHTPLTLSVVAKNSAIARSMNNLIKEPVSGCSSVLQTPQLLLTTGGQAVRNTTTPRANAPVIRTAACSGNFSVMVKSNQLTRGQFFTSSQGPRLFVPTGARPIEKASLTNATSSNIIIRPASSLSMVAGGARLQASSSPMFVLPDVRKSVPARPGSQVPGAPTLSMTVPRQQAARAAISKVESSAPLYLLVENSSSKAATSVNNKQTPIQFLVMPDVNSVAPSETPVQLTGSEIRTLTRATRPHLTTTVSSLAARSAVQPTIASGAPMVCFSVSNSLVVGETPVSSVARTKSSGQISLLRAAQTVPTDSVSTSVKTLNTGPVANSIVLPGGNTFSTKIGGQTVIVDMVGTSPSGLSPSMSCSRALLSNGTAPNLSVVASQHLPSIGKDRLLSVKNMRELVEKKVTADTTLDIISSLNNYGSMEDLVRLLVSQCPLFASNIDRSLHPYCAPSWDAFLKWNVGKRRAAELCRAKKIQDRIIRALNGARSFRGEEVWSWRRIVIWCRRHLYTPLDNEICCRLNKEVRSELDVDSSVTALDPLLDSLEGAAEKQTTLSTGSDIEIDVIEIDDEPTMSVGKKEVTTPMKSSGLVKEYLPLSAEGQFVHEVIDQFGIRPNPVAVDGFPCVFASSVEEMIARSMKLFINDMMRTTGAMMFDSGRKPTEMNAVDIFQCLVSEDKFDFLTNKHMGVTLVDDDLPNTSDCDL